MLRKLTSRKLWMAIGGIVAGLVIVLRLDSSTIATISGAVVSICSVITYIRTEGKIDAAGIQKIADAAVTVEQAVEAVKDTADSTGNTAAQV